LRGGEDETQKLAIQRLTSNADGGILSRFGVTGTITGGKLKRQEDIHSIRAKWVDWNRIVNNPKRSLRARKGLVPLVERFLSLDSNSPTMSISEFDSYEKLTNAVKEAEPSL